MRTLTYQEEELIQFVTGEDWFVFTETLVIHAPIDRLLCVIDTIYADKPEIIFLKNVELFNAIGAYKEEYYPETILP